MDAYDDREQYYQEHPEYDQQRQIQDVLVALQSLDGQQLLHAGALFREQAEKCNATGYVPFMQMGPLYEALTRLVISQGLLYPDFAEEWPRN